MLYPAELRAQCSQVADLADVEARHNADCA